MAMRKGTQTGSTPGRRRWSLWLLLSGLPVVMVFMAGCVRNPSPEDIYDVLSQFFDGVPRPGEKTEKELEIVKEKLETLEGELVTLKRQGVQPAPVAAQPAAPAAAAAVPPGNLTTWDEVAQALPQAATGGVNWTAALTEGIIAPRGGLTPEAQPQGAMDLDVELVPETGDMFKSTFSHQVHTTWLGCPSCHSGLFQMAKGATPITMQQINNGESCGVCHGPVVFGADACARCHPAMGGVAAATKAPKALKEPTSEAAPAMDTSSAAAPSAAAPVAAVPLADATTWKEVARALPRAPTGGVSWTAGLTKGIIAPHVGLTPAAQPPMTLALDLELVPEMGAQFRATFSHQAHTAWLGCDSCHPSLFQMAKGTTPSTMRQINTGESCGVCHGPVVFGADACARCHPTMGRPARVGKARKPPAPKAPPAVAKIPPDTLTTWDAVVRALPRAPTGGINWTAALTEGIIAPRGGLTPEVQPRKPTDLDVERVPEDGDLCKSTFSHQVHTAWLGCDSCHPSLFQMAREATPITMELINAGDSCGVCHGSVVFGADACARCHPAMEGN
jgi:c(7)-type cytochrome triheme protein